MKTTSSFHKTKWLSLGAAAAALIALPMFGLGTANADPADSPNAFTIDGISMNTSDFPQVTFSFTITEGQGFGKGTNLHVDLSIYDVLWQAHGLTSPWVAITLTDPDSISCADIAIGGDIGTHDSTTCTVVYTLDSAIDADEYYIATNNYPIFGVVAVAHHDGGQGQSGTMYSNGGDPTPIYRYAPVIRLAKTVSLVGGTVAGSWNYYPINSADTPFMFWFQVTSADPDLQNVMIDDPALTPDPIPCPGPPDPYTYYNYEGQPQAGWAWTCSYSGAAGTGITMSDIDPQYKLADPTTPGTYYAATNEANAQATKTIAQGVDLTSYSGWAYATVIIPSLDPCPWSGGCTVSPPPTTPTPTETPTETPTTQSPTPQSPTEPPTTQPPTTEPPTTQPPTTEPPTTESPTTEPTTNPTQVCPTGDEDCYQTGGSLVSSAGTMGGMLASAVSIALGGAAYLVRRRGLHTA